MPGYLCQAHHITEWAHDGPTDIDNLTFACTPRHRLLNHGWTTRNTPTAPPNGYPHHS
nr:HNH endonuclease signature motif containing protein [Mycobacteroides abscessus]